MTHKNVLLTVPGWVVVGDHGGCIVRSPGDDDHFALAGLSGHTTDATDLALTDYRGRFCFHFAIAFTSTGTSRVKAHAFKVFWLDNVVTGVCTTPTTSQDRSPTLFLLHLIRESSTNRILMGPDS